MITEIYYFTGTGNGLHLGKSIKKKLDVMSQEVKLIAINTLDLSQEINSAADKIGIIYPTYAMTSPDIVKRFARKLRIKDSAYVFLFAHCGGGGAKVAVNSIKMILQNKGINIANTFEVTFPSNSAIRGYTKEKLTSVYKKAEPIIEKAVDDIVNDIERDIPELNIIKKSAVSLAENVAGLGEKMLKFKEINADDTCIGCETCVKVCPVNNIELVDRRPAFGDKCEMCLSCINQCPKKSLSYGKMKKSNMISYRHPDVTLKELMYR